MRNFVATVKERGVGETCFVMIELYQEIGLPKGKNLMIDLPRGSNIETAQIIATTLNETAKSFNLL